MKEDTIQTINEQKKRPRRLKAITQKWRVKSKEVQVPMAAMNSISRTEMPTLRYIDTMWKLTTRGVSIKVKERFWKQKKRPKRVRS